MSDTQTATLPRTRPLPPNATEPVWRPGGAPRAPVATTETVTAQSADAERPAWLGLLPRFRFGFRFEPRFGLLAKIILFLAAVLVPLAVVTAYVSVDALRDRMTEEFTSKGKAIANSLASSSEDLIINRDASTVQAAVDRV